MDPETLLESADPSPVVGAAPAADAPPSVESAPDVVEETPSDVAVDSEPEDLSEPQKSNWRRLREARDNFETRFKETEEQLTQFRQKIEPVEPVLDLLVDLGNALAPLDPDASAVRDYIRQISPRADRYLAGAYLQEHGDWFVSHITDGRVSSVEGLKSFLAQGGTVRAEPAPTVGLHQQVQPTGATDPRLQAQLGYLDDDLRQHI
jgi:hypothetical protein